jgi:predicted nucleic acid-binding protein
LRIIIDSNILFSALIKDSITRRIILDYEDQFLFPSYIFEEIEKYKNELLTKSKMKPKDFEDLLRTLLQKVIIIPKEVLIHYKDDAYQIIKDIDPDDVTFIACALAYSDSIVWSDDKKLKQQSKVRIINTNEMYSLIYSKKSK